MIALLVSALIAVQDLRSIMDRAAADFRAGRIEQSLEGFDRVARLSPADAPYLWQRGIAQYYAGKFRECRDVMRAAGSDASAQFFARLYIGLYLEATGQREAGRAQIAIAAENRFARVGGYMHDVARVHLNRK